MLQLRVRLLTDDATQDHNSRILPAQEITHTDALNTSATLSFSVDRADFVPYQTPFVVGVEYSTDGRTYYSLPKSDTFIVGEVEDDSAEDTTIAKYSGVEFAIWLLGGAYVGEGWGQHENERTLDGDGQGQTNPAQIMRYFIAESKERGWLSKLEITASNTLDSEGNAWTADDKSQIAWPLQTFYDKMLNQLTELGYCEWSTNKRRLHMHRVQTLGRDRSNLVIGGPAFTSMRVREDHSGQYTHVLGLYDVDKESTDSGRYHDARYAWESRFGRRSAVLSQSGVKDRAEAIKQVQAHLAKGNEIAREETYTWTPTSKDVYPFKDIGIGDSVTAVARGARTARRIIGMTIIQSIGTNDGWAEAQVRVGDKLTTAQVKNQRLLSTVSVGTAIGGSGGAISTSPVVEGVRPQNPAGLFISGNTGEWVEGNVPRSVVELGWSPVTYGIPDDPELSPTGPAVTIAQYEVWSRLPGGNLKRDLSVEGNRTSITVESWTPGVERLVAVRALTDRGRWSDYSLELSVTPTMPDSRVPKAPTGFTITNVSAFWGDSGPMNQASLDWDDVTESVEGADIQVQQYDVWADGSYLTSVTTSAAVITYPYTPEREFRVRAVSTLGMVSDPTPTEVAVGGLPAAEDLATTVPLLTSKLGTVTVTWDGGYTDPDSEGARSVRVERLISGNTWQTEGVPLQDAGSITFSAAIGTTVTVRLRALDKLNRPTGTSATASIVVAGVDDGFVDQFWASEANIGKVTTDVIASNVGSSLNISSNESINILVGNQNNIITDLSNTADAAEAAAAEAAEALRLATEAAAAAELADAKALVAQAGVNGLDTEVAKLTSAIVIDENGIRISALDTTHELVLGADGISIRHGGSDVSVWSGNQLIVSEAVVNTLRLGGHIWEKSGDKRSVIRPL